MPSVIVIPDPAASEDPGSGTSATAVLPRTPESPTPPESAPPAEPPVAVDAEPADRPRPLHVRPMDDWISTIGSALGSLGLVWVLYEKILPFSGTLGFLICWYVAFLAMYGGVSALSHPRPVVVDRLASALVHGAAVVVGLALLVSVSYPFVRGFQALRHLNFYTSDMSGVRPTSPLDQGGILHAIVGSFIEVGIAAAIALPLGVGTAVFMTEVGGKLTRAVRTVVEAMTALPDILAGLFIYTTLIVALGVQRSGFAAAMALTIMMLPIIARTSDVTLRVVPGGLREAGLALGASQWQTVWRVVLPTARPGLATALILGIARAVGETAPVLITSGASTFFNANPINNPMNSLPLFIYTAVRSGENNYIARGLGAAAVLLTIVLVLFAIVRYLARPRVGNR
jgi:phosphate transport system permease protein